MSARVPSARGVSAAKTSDYGALSRVPRTGSALASFLKMSALPAVIGLALTQMACLVTESVPFPDEANVPPSIVSSAGAVNPLDEIVRFDLDSTGPTDGGGGTQESRFQVQVRDPNVSQSLQAKVFVNSASLLDREIPPMGSQLARPFEFTVPASSFSPAGNCYKVELLVSGGFRFGSRVPIDPADIAQAVWWVRSIDSGHLTVDMALCNP